MLFYKWKRLDKIVNVYNILVNRDGRMDDKRENMEVDVVRILYCII